jgi:hypothetical protein
MILIKINKLSIRTLNNIFYLFQLLTKEELPNFYVRFI